jgi:hypothetical protein
VKAKSALEGRTIREITMKLYDYWLQNKSESWDIPQKDWVSEGLKLSIKGSSDVSGLSSQDLLRESRERV